MLRDDIFDRKKYFFSVNEEEKPVIVSVKWQNRRHIRGKIRTLNQIIFVVFSNNLGFSVC